jgi:hypothetical protein
MRIDDFENDYTHILPLKYSVLAQIISVLLQELVAKHCNTHVVSFKAY